MKRFKTFSLFVGATILTTLFSFTTTTLAAEVVQTVTETDITGTYDLDSYRSYIESSGFFDVTGKVEGAFNSIANLFFALNKIVYSAIHAGIQLFGGNSVVNDNVSTFSNLSKTMFDNLWSQFGLTIIVIMALYIFWLFVFKSRGRGLRQLVVFVGISVLAFSWNAHSDELVSGINDMTNEVQTALMTGDDDGTGNAYTGVENTFFKLAVQEPYYLMNYGSADPEVINQDKDYDLANSLLTPSGEKVDLDVTQDKVDDQINDAPLLAMAKLGWKFSICMLSPLMTLAVGIPMLLIQMVNFIFQIVSLVVSGFLGLALVASMVPALENVLTKAFKTLIGTFAVRIILGVVFTMLIAVISVIRSIIPTTSLSNYLLQIITIAFAIVFLWKYKNKILGFVTGGRVNSMYSVAEKHVDKTKGGIRRVAETAADVVAISTIGTAVSQMGLAHQLREKSYDRYKNRKGLNNTPNSDAKDKDPAEPEDISRIAEIGEQTRKERADSSDVSAYNKPPEKMKETSFGSPEEPAESPKEKQDLVQSNKRNYEVASPPELEKEESIQQIIEADYKVQPKITEIEKADLNISSLEQSMPNNEELEMSQQISIEREFEVENVGMPDMSVSGMSQADYEQNMNSVYGEKVAYFPSNVPTAEEQSAFRERLREGRE